MSNWVIEQQLEMSKYKYNPVKVIETIMWMETGYFQSRVIQVDSWDDYVKEIKDGNHVSRDAFLGNLYGYTVPFYKKDTQLEIIMYDPKELIAFEFTTFDGKLIRKMSYLVKE
jgi:ABC-type proline/glycine betaine transport system substrate-binding protein